jgi:uncharacterized membrane protein YoaK (UPF0700 family)
MGRDLALATLPFTLSLIAGSTDTIGFLSLNGLFTAHVTGNLVMLAAHLITGDSWTLSYMLAVPVFALVQLLTSLLASRLEGLGVATLRPLLSLQLLLLGLFLLLGVTCRSQLHSDSVVAVIAGMFGVAAMAVQTALVQISLPDTPSTAVMTTNLTHFAVALGQVLAGRDVAVVDNARRCIFRTFCVIAGFGVGCAAGAAGEAQWGPASLALPAALALLVLIATSPPAPAS